MSETRSSDDARDAAARPSMVEPRGKKARAGQPTMTVRARRRREEAVRRLVADVQSKADSTIDQAAAAEAHDWLVASTVATALEKGLDRDLHAELVQEAKDNAGRIGQVCHDHADVFLASVAQVAALAGPTADLADGLKDAEQEMLSNTAGPMHQAARQWQDARRSHARARTLNVMVDACQGVALQLERARKQAALGRPRAALDAVDQARTALTIPVESLFQGKDERLWKETLSSEEQKVDDMHQKKLSNLEQTPFGKRATVVLPKIENEVLMSAKRGLNKWFLALRSGGEGAKVGRAVLRQCAHSLAAGPGLLGLGGTLPPAYVWRAKMADNLISRVGQSSKVARAARQGYWFDRDAPREADRLETVCPREGTERYAEAVAFAFGWYRCWEDGSTQLVDPSEFAAESLDTSGRGDGLRGSRHGLRGSRHGRGRSLGFRAKTSSRSQTYEEISSTLGASGLRVSNQASQWAELLIPSVLYSISPTRREEDEMLRGIAESVHPVRRAEVAYGLLGKTEEFVQYYEQNRFGEMTIGGDGNDDLGERKSSLSWLTGDDISIGTDRIFFAKTLPNALIPSVVGYSAVESALELSNFADEEESDKDANGPVRGTTGTVGASLNASRFRDSSERYERALVTELGHLIRARALRANLGELVRSSNLLVAFRAALKIVHPSSTARRADKDLLALDTDMLTTALRIAQDEQLKATMAIVMDDQKVPMLVSEVSSSSSGQKSGGAGVPDPEEVGLPFGLSQMKQKPQKSEIEFQEQSRTSYNQAPLDECFTFSHSVPVILRSIHARAITCAAFALSQQELGQKFPETKKVGGPAGYVFDCVEECINAAVIGMKDSDNIIAEGSVEKAVQVMANVVALQRYVCYCVVKGTLKFSEPKGRNSPDVTLLSPGAVL
jgi:hypothetical protein